MIIVKEIKDGKKTVIAKIYDKGDLFVIGYFGFIMGCAFTYYWEPIKNLFIQ